MLRVTRARLALHGRFYGRLTFCCKTTQFCATHRERWIAKYLASAMLCKSIKWCATR